MAELLRARKQNQMNQQQFGLPSSQMNAPSQHSGFHDQQGGQQGQNQMPTNFGNVANSAQLQATINARNLQGLGQSAFSRQIEMMNLAQNQQHQNPQIGPPTFVTRMPQHQQHQASMNAQSGQNQGQPLFGSQPATDANRGSPPHPAQIPGPAQVSNAQNLPAGRRPMTYTELRERAATLQAFIAKQESMAMTLSNNRALVDHTTFMNRMQQLAAEVRGKKELLAKVTQAMNAVGPQGQGQNSNGSQGGNPGNL